MKTMNGLAASGVENYVSAHKNSLNLDEKTLVPGHPWQLARVRKERRVAGFRLPQRTGLQFKKKVMEEV
jgi:hypothetical protein